MTSKPTYKFWIRYHDGPFDAGYYMFKTWKVYWAYRWYNCEQLDKVGFIKGTVNPRLATEKDYVKSTYAEKFKNTNKIK